MSEGRPPDPLVGLGERIDRARGERVRRQPAVADRSALQQGIGFGLRIGFELVVAIGVATGLGWAIDRWLGTRPWGMVVLFFLGIAAGMLDPLSSDRGWRATFLFGLIAAQVIEGGIGSTHERLQHTGRLRML